LGIELGMSLIDPAEMCGDGGAEKSVTKTIQGQHQGVFVVTKVYPHNASRSELQKAYSAVSSASHEKGDLADLDCEFPVPKSKKSLPML